MNLDTLEKMIELVRKHGMQEVTVEDGGKKYTVKAPNYAVGLAPSLGQMPVAPYAASLPTNFPGYGHAPNVAAAAAPIPPTTANAAAAGTSAKSGKLIRSPFVGTLYRSPAPGAPCFVEVGKRVRKGETLCIIEAMKLMNEIESEFDGVIKEILVENEHPVEFDQPLFVLE